MAGPKITLPVDLAPFTDAKAQIKQLRAEARAVDREIAKLSKQGELVGAALMPHLLKRSAAVREQLGWVESGQARVKREAHMAAARERREARVEALQEEQNLFRIESPFRRGRGLRHAARGAELLATMAATGSVPESPREVLEIAKTFGEMHLASRAYGAVAGAVSDAYTTGGFASAAGVTAGGTMAAAGLAASLHLLGGGVWDRTFGRAGAEEETKKTEKRLHDSELPFSEVGRFNQRENARWQVWGDEGMYGKTQMLLAGGSNADIEKKIDAIVTQHIQEIKAALVKQSQAEAAVARGDFGEAQRISREAYKMAEKAGGEQFVEYLSNPAEVWQNIQAANFARRNFARSMMSRAGPRTGD
jgi:hypothetical protein